MMIFSFLTLRGQDPQFSQFYNHSLYYNPAATGISRDLRFLSTYRNLWCKIPGDLSTYFISADYQWAEKKAGLGFLLLNDYEGLHHIKTTRAELTFSYRVIQEENTMLQFGMSVFSVNIRDFQTNGLIFSDQPDLTTRTVGQSTYITDDMEAKIYPDWNAGMVYRRNIFGKRKITPTIGFSISHILRPNISFINSIYRLPVKYVVNANLLTPVTINNHIIRGTRVIYLKPGFVYEYQNPFQSFTLGSDFDCNPFRFGMWFRNRNYFSDDIYKFNSIIVHAGFVLPLSPKHDLIIDYSYDSTVSKLEFAAGGAHEISIIYNISLPEKKAAVKCFTEWWR